MASGNYVFEQSEYLNRHKQVIDELNENEFNIIFSRPDLFYYSGTGIDGIITIEEEEITRYARRNLDLAKEESVVKTKHMDSFRIFKKLGRELDVSKLGLELDYIPFRTAEYIKQAFGDPELVDIGNTLREIRSVKSDAEIEYMKAAAKQTDESFKIIEEKIKPGISELELAAEIEHYLLKQGHPGHIQVRTFYHNQNTLSFVMAGESTAQVNSVFAPTSGQGACRMYKTGPSQRKIKQDDAVLIDTTGSVEGYIADETRTFFVGNPPEELRDALEVAKEIQRRTKSILTAGNSPPEIYEEIHELANEMGFGQEFMGPGEDIVPFVGHGIGLELDDLPVITDKYSKHLEEGNIVAMEPKFISTDVNSGVGIEDSWVVGKNGAERITQFPWD